MQPADETTNVSEQIQQEQALPAAEPAPSSVSLKDYIFNYPYLTESAKISLKDYKYKSGDASILSHCKYELTVIIINNESSIHQTIMNQKP